MAPAKWSWNRAVGSEMAAVMICTVAIRQRDYMSLQGFFHDHGVIGMGVMYIYNVYISPLSARVGESCFYLFIN